MKYKIKDKTCPFMAIASAINNNYSYHCGNNECALWDLQLELCTLTALTGAIDVIAEHFQNAKD
jgi:hypothetical protein